VLRAAAVLTAAIAIGSQSTRGDEPDPIWTFDGGDGALVGQRSYGPGRGISRRLKAVLRLPKWKRSDLEACRFTSQATIFRVKTTSECFMVFHWRESGEDDSFGVQTIEYADQTRASPDHSRVFDRDGWEFATRFQSLAQLVLTGEEASDEHLLIVAALKNLSSLTIFDGAATPNGYRPLGLLRNLKELRFYKANVTDATLADWASLTQLTELTLRETQVTGATFASLGAMSRLKTLNLFGSPIRDENLKPLRDLPVLTQLFLDFTPISDGAVEPLRGLSLKSLGLVQTGMSPEARRALLASLPGPASRRRELRDAPWMRLPFLERQQREQEEIRRGVAWVFERGGRVECLVGHDWVFVRRAEDLPETIRLRSVELRGGVLHHDADVARINDLRTNGILRLDLESAPIDGSGLRALEESPVHLNLNRTRTGDETLRMLRCFSILELSLDDTRITNAGLPALSATGIYKLTANGTGITDAGMEYLAHIELLNHLELDRTPLSDEGLRSLEQLRFLKFLSCRRTKVTSAGIARLKAALPECRVAWDEAD
jgi:hypothetical protein